MDTKTIGSTYLHTAYCAPDVSVFHTAETQEIEEPFRTGKCVVFRLPLTRRAVVVGRWVGQKSEFDALSSAIKMSPVDRADFEGDL